MADDDDEPKGPPGSPAWMATYGDLVTLLLCFFVLLYSMSVVDAKKFEATFSSVRDSFGGDQKENVKAPEVEVKEPSEMAEVIRMEQDMVEAQKEFYEQVRSFISQEAMEDQITALFDDGKIILRIPGDVLFSAGSEYISASANDVLYTLLQIFHAKRDQMINVKGYSDNTAVPAGARFYDNWELSALRAVNILRYYVNAGIGTHRIIATGMGELDPLAPNNTPENMAKNRRVEFVLEKDVSSNQ